MKFLPAKDRPMSAVPLPAIGLLPANTLVLLATAASTCAERHLGHRLERAVDPPLALLAALDLERIGAEVTQLLEPGELAQPLPLAAEHVIFELVRTVEAEPEADLLEPVHVHQRQVHEAGELGLGAGEGVDVLGQLDIIGGRRIAATLPFSRSSSTQWV